MNPPRGDVLLAGVPFGCDNVGDEAICTGIVGLLRERLPELEIGVCARDGGTARRLGLNHEPLLGHDLGCASPRAKAVLSTYRHVLWAGATGLSDYPETGTAVLRAARAAGCRTGLFAVGMNDELNPAWYRLGPGPRRTSFAALRLLSLGLADPAGSWEARRRERAIEALVAEVGAADLCTVRDAASAARLCEHGVDEVAVAADPAIAVAPTGPPAELAGWMGDRRCAAFCVSAQRPIGDRDGLRDLLSGLRERGRSVLLVPMNPVSDRAAMRGLDSVDEVRMVRDVTDPGTVAGILARCSLAIASRLHLLILASIGGAACVGIARGSKFGDFLADYGDPVACTVEDFSAPAVLRAVDSVDQRGSETRRRAREVQLGRLAAVADSVAAWIGGDRR